MRTVILALLLLNVIQLFSQTLNEEQLKYWYYRDRLRYFVYPGTEDGASLLMTCRNSIYKEGPNRLYNGVEWGQTRKINGYYIGLLATEYKLLMDNGQYSDAQQTLNELDLALDALVRIDKCEDLEPWNSTEYFDGFFIRSNVTLKLLTKLTYRKLNTVV